LRELGHELIESEVDLLPTSRFMGATDGFTNEELEVRARTTEQILAEIRAAHERAGVDLFLSYFYNAHFDPAGFDELRRLGVPSVNFYCNSIHQFAQVAAIAAKADFAWHAERDARSSYLAVGAKPIWTQMGADPKVYHPVPEMTRAARACFVGSVTPIATDGWLPWCAPARPSIYMVQAGFGFRSGGACCVSSSAAKHLLGRAQPSPGSRASYVAAFRETLQRDGLFCGLVRVGRQLHYRARH